MKYYPLFLIKFRELEVPSGLLMHQQGNNGIINDKVSKGEHIWSTKHANNGAKENALL